MAITMACISAQQTRDRDSCTHSRGGAREGEGDALIIFILQKRKQVENGNIIYPKSHKK